MFLFFLLFIFIFIYFYFYFFLFFFSFFLFFFIVKINSSIGRDPVGKDPDRHYKICGCKIRRLYYNGGIVDVLTFAIPVLVYLELDRVASQVYEDLALRKMDRNFLKGKFHETGRSRIDRTPFADLFCEFKELI